MAWFPTHFTLEGLIAWLLLSEERKAEFKQKWYLFLLLNLTAVIPDSDVLFRSHRGIFNSLLIPMTILTLGFSIFLVSQILANEAKKAKIEFLALCMLLIAFFWGFHIILDVDDGLPNALFYPLDNKTYEISFLLEMTSQAALPVGLVIDVIFQPLAAGLSTYVLNWTPEQRLASFGETFFFALPEMVLNLSIAVCWLYFVGREVIPLSRFGNLLASRKKTLISFKKIVWNTFTAVGVIFILFGLFLGPVLEQRPVQSITVSRTLNYSPRAISPSFSTGMETMNQLLQPRATHSVSIDFITTMAESPGNATWIGAFCLASDYSKDFTSKVIPLFVQHFNKTQLPENDTLFKTGYQNIVSDFLNDCLIASEPLETNNVTLTLDITGPGTYMAVAILSDWDSYQQLNETVVSRNVSIDMQVQYDRSINYSLGLLLMAVGLIIVIIPSVQQFRLHGRKKVDKGTTDDTKLNE